MLPKSEIFNKTYNDYLAQIANTDIISIKDRLCLKSENNQQRLISLPVGCKKK